MENWRDFTSKVINEENFNSLEKLKTALGDSYSAYAPGGTRGYANEKELAAIAPFVTNDKQLDLALRYIKIHSGKKLLNHFKRRKTAADKAAAAARPPSPASGSRKYDTVQHKAIVMQLLATPGKERELEDYMRTHADKFKPDFVAAVERGDSAEVERLAKQPGN